MGVAAASYWLIGFRPSISSIVRSMPEVEYMGVVYEAAFHRSARHKCNGAMCIDVVRPGQNLPFSVAMLGFSSSANHP